MDYEKQAQDFLNKTNTTVAIDFVKHGKHFVDDDNERDIYKVTLRRGEREFIFNFGQSIAHSGYKIVRKSDKAQLHKGIYADTTTELKKVKVLARKQFQTLNGLEIITPETPTAYDILASLTKYETGNFKEFCSSFGYDIDSIKALKIYEAVKNEWLNVKALWAETELIQLREIN